MENGNSERNKTLKSKKDENVRKEGKIQVFENTVIRHDQTIGNEGKNIKRLTQKNEKISRNQAL